MAPTDQLASTLFSTWWIAIGANKVVYGLLGLGAENGLVDLSLYTTIIFVNLLLLCFSLTCLLYYLLYVFTGTKTLLLPILVLYGMYFFVLVYNIVSTRPTGFTVGPWRTAFVPSVPSNPALLLMILVFLAVPQTLASISYLVLGRRVTDPEVRHRIRFASWSIIALTLSIVLIPLPGAFQSDAAQILIRAFGMLAALLGLFAYSPPRWLRRSVGLAPTS
ncbi:MAG: hypothetical protein HY556_02970 [Euryarchaeota archaeon]|nr:hypothetical protein [Euryarchaeota archaeon]